MLSVAQRQRLNFFNEQATRLLSSDFLQTMLGESTGFTLSAEQGGPLTAEVRGPGPKAIDGFVLPYRFFVQDGRERISFRCMAELYDEAAPADLAAQFRELCEAVNRFLDLPAGHTFNDEALTRRRVVDVFLYGSGLAHAEESKRAVFEQWREVPIFLALLQNEFVAALAVVAKAVRNAQELNAALLGS